MTDSPSETVRHYHAHAEQALRDAAAAMERGDWRMVACHLMMAVSHCTEANMAAVQLLADRRERQQGERDDN